MTLVETSGILRYNQKWAWLECCRDTIRLYQWFLQKKGIWLNEPVWKAHVTIVRETDTVESFEDLKVGEAITFRYDPRHIHTNGRGGHWWLEVESGEAETLRRSLGLDPIPEFDFHLTIGKEYQRRLGCRFGE